MLANKGQNVNSRARFLNLVRIHVFPETMSFTKQVHVRIDGEIYDISNGTFVEAYEVPKSTFPVPIDCNDLCLVEEAGAHAREISNDLGETLIKQLGHYIKTTSVGGSSSVKVISGADTSVAAVSYTFNLKNFKLPEIDIITKGVRENTKGTIKLELIETSGTTRKYQFISQGKNEQIVDSLNALMSDMKLADDDYRLSFSNQTISIEKLR
jgi:hypothetical protein